MEKLTSETLRQLIDTDLAGLKVTIYAPMHVTGAPPHLTENQIRYKNLIHAACRELQAHGDEQLEKALKLHLEKVQAGIDFFECQTKGLLVCADAGSIRTFHLPIDTEEYVSVDDAYHLAPVMGLVAEASEFYVLTLAQHRPVLYRGDMYGLVPSGIELPETLVAGLNIDETNQKSEQSLSAGGSSLNTAGFNGRGGARNPGEEDRMRFFRMIDNIIMHNADRSLPMALAGIDAEVAEYRAHSKYPKLLEGSLSGNFNDTKLTDLFEQANTVVRAEVIAPKQSDAVEHFDRLRGAHPERTAADTNQIASAAEQGRVETLLLQMTRTTHDTVRDTSEADRRITFPEKSVSKSLNDLAHKVVSMSGQVVNLDDTQMPGKTPAAATLRF